MAETQGRRWVTCETDPDYVEVAAARLRDLGGYAGKQTRETEAELAERRAKLRR